MAALRGIIELACVDLGDAVNAEPIMAETVKNLYDGVPMSAGLRLGNSGCPHDDRKGSGL